MNSIERNGERSGFAELTKLAGKTQGPAPAASADSSGYVDLALFSANDPHWVERALAQAHPEVPPLLAIAPPRRTRAWLVGGAIALASVVSFGAAALVVRQVRHTSVVPTVASVSAAVVAPAHAEIPDPIPAPAPPPVVDQVQAQAPAPAVDDEKVAAPAKAIVAASPARHESRSRTPRTVAAISPDKGDSLSNSISSAVGPGPVATPPVAAPVAAPAVAAAAVAPPAPAGDARPERPSGGAVTAALRGALPAARACLKTGDAPTRATVIFASTGATSRVQVDGAGAACIQAALTHAKVPAFSAPNYSAAVTVRPL